MEFTIVRPFNWIGPRMDFIPGVDGPSDSIPRVLACFSNVIQSSQPLSPSLIILSRNWKKMPACNSFGTKRAFHKSQMIGDSRDHMYWLQNLMKGEPLKLVDGGLSQRTFIYIKDAIEAVQRMIVRINSHKTSFNFIMFLNQFFLLCSNY